MRHLDVIFFCQRFLWHFENVRMSTYKCLSLSLFILVTAKYILH